MSGGNRFTPRPRERKSHDATWLVVILWATSHHHTTLLRIWTAQLVFSGSGKSQFLRYIIYKCVIQIVMSVAIERPRFNRKSENTFITPNAYICMYLNVKNSGVKFGLSHRLYSKKFWSAQFHQHLHTYTCTEISLQTSLKFILFFSNY